MNVLEIATASELQDRLDWMTSSLLERDYGVKRYMLYRWADTLAKYGLAVKLPAGGRGMWLVSPVGAKFLRGRTGTRGIHANKVLSCWHCGIELPHGTQDAQDGKCANCGNPPLG